MLPEKTNYLTNGIDGQKRLAQGPELSSYRGLSIIHSRKFSMDTGTTPRDLLRRRVRVAEYYRIPWNPQNPSRSYEFYDQSRDTMFRLTWDQLCKMAKLPHGAGGGDEDFPGHYGDYWQIMGGAEPPEDFDFADNDNEPGALRLRVHGKMVPTDTNLTVDGIDTVLSAMGFNVGVKHKTSSLVWPRTVYSTSQNGRDRKKRKIDTLTVSVGDSLNSPSSRYIYNAMNEMQKSHHQQSETFGAGLFNDPISDDSSTTLVKNWDGLSSITIQNANAVVAGLCVRAFMDLHKQLGLEVAEQQLISGHVRPCAYEKRFPNAASTNLNELVGASFDAEVAVRASMVKNEHTECVEYWTDNTKLTKLMNGTIKKVTSTGFMAAHSFSSKFDKLMDFDTLGTKPTNINHALVDLMATYLGDEYTDTSKLTKDFKFYAAIAMLHYIKILVEWRKLCFGDAVENMLSDNIAGGPTLISKNNCGGHNKFDKMRTSIITACMCHSDFNVFDSEVNSLSRNYAIFSNNLALSYCQNPKNASLMKEVMNDIKSNTVNGNIAVNMLNSMESPNAVILQPNMHINRCKPLRSADAEDSASSINPSSWLLQHLASMFPISKTLAEMLLKENASTKKVKSKLAKQYSSFLKTEESGIKTSAVDIAPEYNTFLMHWFMSEFHPTYWVRQAAKKACGVTPLDIKPFMNAMASALLNNSCENVSNACEQLIPGMYESGESKSVYSTASATAKYEDIHKWWPDKNLHISTLDWKKVPVDRKLNEKVLTNVYNTGHATLEAMTESAEKSFAKAACKYKRAGLGDAVDTWDSTKNTIPREKQVFFFPDEDKVRPVGSDEHLINWSHPWTNYIPGGVESISSANFPLDYHGHSTPAVKKIYDDSQLKHAADRAAENCQEYPEEAIRDVLLILFSRFFKPAARFVINGAGLPVDYSNYHEGEYFFPGCHLKHGPYVAEISDSGPGGSACAQDIVILRPNIEHEMLGIIMGRGGTQELGATFWGQV